ncbi:HEAT repeat domain-containing protein, partial [candidate division CSSED10-310 bacterium]
MMRKIHVYLNELREEKECNVKREKLISILEELEPIILAEFYSTIRRPFSPFLMVQEIDNADVALLFLGNQDTAELKETYYQAYGEGIPVFIVADSDKTGDILFRQELLQRHPHFIANDELSTALKLKEHLTDFFYRELRTIFVPRYSQVQAKSLIEGYQRDWQVFVPPAVFAHAQQVLANNNFIILYGPAHSGKTCLARNLMKQYYHNGYQLNEILSPILSPRMFINFMKSNQKIITCFDTKAYTYEWDLQVTAGIMRIFFATLEKWTDPSHPMILIISNKKISDMIETFQKQEWSSLSDCAVYIPPYQLSSSEVDEVVEKHLTYYSTPDFRHQELKQFFQDMYSSETTPSLLFYTMRFGLFPQRPTSITKLKDIRNLKLLTQKRLFQFYLQSASLKELLILYVVLATEMELDYKNFEQLINHVYHFSLYMEGKIIDYNPQKQQWIDHIFNELNGSVLRRYRYDEEDRVVFAHETFRNTVNRYFKRHARKPSHRIIGEAIVEFLMKQSFQQGKFFAIRFLFDHYRAFSLSFRKKVLYSLVRDPDKEVRAHLVRNLYRLYYLIGKEGHAILNHLLHDPETHVRMEHGRAFGIKFNTVQHIHEQVLEKIKQDEEPRVRRSLAQYLSIDYPSQSDRAKQIITEMSRDKADDVKGGIIFGLINNYHLLDQDGKTLVNDLLNHKSDTIIRDLARVCTYLPYETLRTSLQSLCHYLSHSSSSFVRAHIVRAIGGKLERFPQQTK